MLEYLKPNLEKAIFNMNRTYEDACKHKEGNVTLRVLPPEDVEFYEEINLTQFQFEKEEECVRYAKMLCEKQKNSFLYRKELDDNMIPSFTPVLGIGDYSAFVAGGITFTKDTSWPEHVLDKPGDFRKLPPLGTSLWYQRFLHICELMLKEMDGTGIPFMRGFFSPLDLAHALLGEDIYYAFYDEPEELHALLDYSADATIRFADDIYALAGKYLRGTKYGMWYLEGNINMSEDIACMISGELYREFCAPHTQKVIDHFGRGFMHCHSRAMYLVKEICQLNQVAHLWLATDPNQPRPIQHIPELVEAANGVCLAIDCDNFSEIEGQMDELKKGNFSICLPVKSIEEGKEYIRRFEELCKE